MGRKIKDFPSNINKTDFTFSNKNSDYKENISFEKIFENSDDIENDLEKTVNIFGHIQGKIVTKKIKDF